MAVAQFDWTDNLVRKFDRAEQVQAGEGRQPQWSARQHHDWQRES